MKALGKGVELATKHGGAISLGTMIAAFSALALLLSQFDMSIGDLTKIGATIKQVTQQELSIDSLRTDNEKQRKQLKAVRLRETTLLEILSSEEVGILTISDLWKFKTPDSLRVQ